MLRIIARERKLGRNVDDSMRKNIMHVTINSKKYNNIYINVFFLFIIVSSKSLTL